MTPERIRGHLLPCVVGQLPFDFFRKAAAEGRRG